MAATSETNEDFSTLFKRARASAKLEDTIKKSVRAKNAKPVTSRSEKRLKRQDKLIDSVLGVHRERTPLDSAAKDRNAKMRGTPNTLMLEDGVILMGTAQFAKESNVDPQTTIIRARKSGIKGRVNTLGVTVYRLRDLIIAVMLGDDEGKLDIDKLDPLKRKAHYQAENDRLKLMVSSGQLVPIAGVEKRLAAVAKLFAQFCDTLPDILERDCGAKPDFLKSIEQRLDSLREDMYKDLLAEDADEPEKLSNDDTNGGKGQKD